ncbi:MAG: hypothetical protein ACOC84_06680 [Actinomycetota bacterium]
MACTAALAVVAPGHRRPAGTALGALLALADLVQPCGRQRWLGPMYLTKLVAGHGSLPDPVP